MPLRRSLGLFAVLAALFLTPTLSAGQVRDLVPGELLDRSRSSGDRIRFCLNPASALMEFDRAVGAYLAESLLLASEFHELTYPARQSPFEYNLTLPDQELFIQITNNCDALLGYPLPDVGAIQDWLTSTQPYYLAPFALALGSGAPDTVDELPPGTQIGSRIGIIADMYVRAFFRDNSSPLTRRVYPTNNAIITDLIAGTLMAAIVWAPAVAVAAQTLPEAGAIRLLDPPFPVAPLQVTIVLPVNQLFLRETLDPAIEAFREGGGLATLLEEFGLPAE